jgi:hypothetical protein
MNEIYIEQNKPENLKLICAFRQSYYKAKQLLLTQIYITVVLTVCFSTAKFLLTLIDKNAAAYAVVYSVFVFIVDFFVLQPMISCKRTDGAKIQEEFDNNLFKLPWNKITVGKKVEKEEIDLLNESYVNRLHGNIKKCKDWYPEEYKVFDMHKAVLCCQKTSLVYDIKLRKKFKFLIVRNTALLSLLVITLCLIKDLSVSSFLIYVVLPLLPVIVLAKKLHAEQEKSIKASSELKSMIDDIQAKNEEISVEDLKAVQTKIYYNRKDSALIPEKLYNRLRDKLEKQMHIHAAGEIEKS